MIVANSPDPRIILFPSNMRKEFKDMRKKFALMYSSVRDILVKRKKLDINSVKQVLIDYDPGLESRLARIKTINKVLEVVKSNCTIIDVSCLKVIIDKIKSKKAEAIIRSYEIKVEEFCGSITAELCLEQKLQAIPVSPHLLCETAIFVLNWKPNMVTLKDINDVLCELKPLAKFYIKVELGRSVAVTYYCPTKNITLLIITVFAKMEILEERGLKEFIIGDCTIWNVADNISFKITATEFSRYGGECVTVTEAVFIV